MLNPNMINIIIKIRIFCIKPYIKIKFTTLILTMITNFDLV